MTEKPDVLIQMACTAPAGTEDTLQAAAAAVAGFVCPLVAEGQVWVCGFRMSDDAEVQSLNKKFRSKDKPTNVLSFPADADMQMPDEPYYLGDVIFALETIQAEAASQKKTFENHLKHLAVHGLLHLYGYDHIHDDDAAVMETLEIDILKALNISNPYNDES